MLILIIYLDVNVEDIGLRNDDNLCIRLQQCWGRAELFGCGGRFGIIVFIEEDSVKTIFFFFSCLVFIKRIVISQS